MSKYLAKRWFFLLMLLGLIFASKYPREIDQALEPIAIGWIAAAALFAMSLGLKMSDFRKAIARPAGLIWALVISFLVAPAICAALAYSLLVGDYQIGLIVTGCLPCTLTSAAIWTRLAGGNDSLALVVTLTSNVLVVVLTPLAILVLTGMSVQIDVIAMTKGLLLYAVLPIAAGQVLRSFAAVARLVTTLEPVLRIVCRILVLLMILIAAVDAKLGLEREGKVWTFDNEMIWLAVACVAAHTLSLAIGYLSSRWVLGREDAIAIAISGSQKTLPIGTFLLAKYFSDYPLAVVPLLFYQIAQLAIDTYAAEIFFYHQRPSDNEPEEEPLPPPDFTNFS